MLFNAANWESEKERNLYAKFFAGYFFNPFAPGRDARMAQFSALLEFKAQEAQFDRGPHPIALSPHQAHVSFDNHIWRLSELDRGEFADILVYDDNFWISFEAKFLRSFNCEKDIAANLNRL